VILLLVGALLGGCSGAETVSVPFEISAEVDETLAGWNRAGITCDGPELGMPGPVVSWSCRGRFDGVDVGVRLTADRHGLQSIHAGVASTMDRAATARGFVDLIDATSALAQIRSEIAEWLLANDAADGTMPISPSTAVGRVAVDTDPDGDVVLYVIPVGSSIKIAP
jgi:hypothetical protein